MWGAHISNLKDFGEYLRCMWLDSEQFEGWRNLKLLIGFGKSISDVEYYLKTDLIACVEPNSFIWSRHCWTLKFQIWNWVCPECLNSILLGLSYKSTDQLNWFTTCCWKLEVEICFGCCCLGLKNLVLQSKLHLVSYWSHRWRIEHNWSTLPENECGNWFYLIQWWWDTSRINWAEDKYDQHEYYCWNFKSYNNMIHFFLKLLKISNYVSNLFLQVISNHAFFINPFSDC